MTVEAALGLGGNLGDPVAAFAAALARLRAHAGIELKAVSSVWRTAPWGKLDQPEFRNMAVLVETSLSAEDLLALCLAIERESGRERRERWGPRTLDIDILTYGDEAIDRPGLQVPHPRIAERAFVLAPLAEIAPEIMIGGRSVATLRAAIASQDVSRDADDSARLKDQQADQRG
ncbi:2-amino-4-hydroxy-6-hydroxymethyldihydropteridine diphosphokinase [Bosea sp. CS1GBMeth4]|uniref:2-amino-4-hydroxy-6- hydroxymethyldihydropteridine diphosphokinase n=1 Tax=Bosea sp. CS1GBMeth4 TaxID=1892849 RepID=UPI001646384F|nr:2-amino-4-hydroxy-6-hydroxymethyldihydropteridine diphosphokinase [Bosea sp. CS1GBMeth4]